MQMGSTGLNSYGHYYSEDYLFVLFMLMLFHRDFPAKKQSFTVSKLTFGMARWLFVTKSILLSPGVKFFACPQSIGALKRKDRSINVACC